MDFREVGKQMQEVFECPLCRGHIDDFVKRISSHHFNKPLMDQQTAANLGLEVTKLIVNEKGQDGTA